MNLKHPKPPTSSDVTLATSSQVKLAEYRRMAPGVAVIEGADLPEIQGTPSEIIIHKAIDAGPGMLVEDSIMVVNGEPWIDVKWRFEEMAQGRVKEGTPLSWEVRLGVLHEGFVYVYYAEVTGYLCRFKYPGGGFDPYFLVPDEGKSFAELELEGRKDAFSPRRLAIESFIAQNTQAVIGINSVKRWAGLYQND